MNVACRSAWPRWEEVCSSAAETRRTAEKLSDSLLFVLMGVVVAEPVSSLSGSLQFFHSFGFQVNISGDVLITNVTIPTPAKSMSLEHQVRGSRQQQRTRLCEI